MKKFLTAVLASVALCSAVLACGGMTQIDPPSLNLNPGSADTSVQSVVEDLQAVCVLL